MSALSDTIGRYVRDIIVSDRDKTRHILAGNTIGDIGDDIVVDRNILMERLINSVTQTIPNNVVDYRDGGRTTLKQNT